MDESGGSGRPPPGGPPWPQPGWQQPPQHGHPQHGHPQHGYPQQPPQHGHPQPPPQHGYPQPPQHGYPQPPQHGYSQPPQHGQPQHGWPAPPAPGQWPHQPGHPVQPGWPDQQGHQPPAPQAGWPQQPPPHGHPQHGHPPPQHGYPPQAPGHWPQQPPGQWPPQPPPGGWPPQPGQQRPATQPPAGGATLGTALGRAFRLRIDPSEVTDHERDTLARAGITSPAVQAFLAWRRSVLLIAAIGILPVLGFRIYETSQQEGNPAVLNGLNAAQLVVDIVFALLLWSQIGRWTNWRKQRRVLAAGWFLFFLMPFVIWLYPLREALMTALRAQAEATGDPTQVQIAAAFSPLVGMTVALFAMLQLAPKAVSLLPGILRASITTKLLFPGASGPGWLILLLAPIYATIMYIVLIVPYQLTGNGFFVAAMVGLIGAQIWLGRMGYRLARPEGLQEALMLVGRVRGGYVLLNLSGMVFVAIGLVDLLEQFDLPVWGMVQVFIALLVNVLLLTLIATDLVIANLARGQVLLAEPGVGQAFATFQRDVAQFADPVVSSADQRR